MSWKGVDSNARCDKTRQNSFFFPNKKERKLCKKKRRKGERGKGRWRCLTFPKGIINYLSALAFFLTCSIWALSGESLNRPVC